MRAEGLNRGTSLLSAGARFERSPGALARILAPGFHKLLDRIDNGVAKGTLTGRLPDGTTRLLGGRAPGFEAEVDLKDWRALVRLATNGSIGWYQAWAAGEWDSPDPVAVFALFIANGETLGNTGRAKGPFQWAARFTHWLNRNTPAGAQRNIHAHYDLGNDFYAAWLGGSMCYSSALFVGSNEPSMAQQMLSQLDYGQLAKVTAIINRVRAHEVESLLDIGCGWGMLAWVAASAGARVDAISLSDQQLAYCRSKGGGKGTPPRFMKQDYRDVAGQYDAIVSVEMVEALGREYWPAFMDCLARNLKPSGRAAIQYISMREELFDAYAASADFIQAYVFPGGLLIRTSEFRRLAEERGLQWTDQTDFGLDYAETLRMWRANFDRAVAEGRLPAGFDERFVALWRYYLMYCEGGFRGGGIDVHQVTLVKAG
ncbi:methyltransferase domain-containing protein [Altererythrobacter aerius]|uniref:Methyltransferase domain-containing protein n=1 Tax=Tsuneonella aeria TaxID=1837929 RepID=A0A6I4TAZ2_9SPHN|nr:cyclopropane-fatty-acyl-phospholipid synthase family protein [Tsuneonella aeria]MXO73756.1 methyltransferase domain-containing protein [Tsuneonella aeria]